MAGDPPPGFSSGGMRTKLAAARIAMEAGCAMAIALGHRERPLSALAAGARCTWFLPAIDPPTARKRWIGGALRPAGALVVDAGAVRALAAGASLLAAGLRAVRGRFGRGEAVQVLDEAERWVATGLAAYGSEDAARIAGLRRDEIETALGWKGRAEVIHRDDLVWRGG
jgi:glutamate 5-kinase